MNFTAIDFETATHARDSACAVGIVTVENSVITETYYALIRPPGNHYHYRNIKVHGIQPHQTANEKPFAEIFPELASRLSGRTIVAHNESFDRSVLSASMTTAGLPYAELGLAPKWQCTMQIYRQKKFKPYKLSDCCCALGIPLDHHHALSDAIGCAELYLRKDTC